jgi:16S rRNA (cytosine967-C5)-methyltransferase
MKTKGVSVRLLALRALNRVILESAYPDLALEGVFKRNPGLSKQETALLTELVYGVIRWLGKLDYVIGLFTRRVRKEEIRNILRLGVYQILFLDGVPDYAAVNETVDIARGIYGRGIGDFVNAVLRRIAREKGSIVYPAREGDPVTFIEVSCSFPRWVVERWIRTYGKEHTERLCNSLNRVPPLTVRINRLKAKREEAIKGFKERGVDSIPTLYSPDGVTLLSRLDPASIPEYNLGLFTVQDEAAQLISYLLDPKPGERILDACSAPGGKTTHIAEIMGNEGEVIAVDISRARLELVRLQAKRLGIGIVRTISADLAGMGSTKGFPKGFDRVLVDAPCSGLGTLRRNPDAKWRKGERDVLELSEIQFKILSRSARMVRPGGVVVYAVCTLMPEENEMVCEGFLHENPDFRMDLEAESTYPFLSGFIDKRGFFVSDPVKHDMDAFFAVRFRRMR